MENMLGIKWMYTNQVNFILSDSIKFNFNRTKSLAGKNPESGF